MEYSSSFASHISGLIEQKRAIGYKYVSEAGTFHRFDVFCIQRHPNEVTITRELMLDWATKRPHESPATLQNRISPIKELAKYMARLVYHPPLTQTMVG